jgi:hypothetical protein
VARRPETEEKAHHSTTNKFASNKGALFESLFQISLEHGKLRLIVYYADGSEERIASIIRVTKIGQLRTTLAVTSNRNTLRNIPEDGILHSHRRQNLKSSIAL